MHSYDPLITGVISPEDLILYWKSRNFYHLSPKDPFFCVKTPQIFIYNMSPKDPTENSFIFVTKRPFFLVNFVTERPLLFKCLMYVSLYKSCAPGYLHPLSILSQSTSVSHKVLHIWGHYTKSTPHRLTRKNTKLQWSIWSLLGNIWNAFLVSIDSESMKI